MDNAANPIERAREAAGLSILALSEATGIPRTTLKRKLGNLSAFTVGELETIARACEADADDLILTVMRQVA